MELNQSLVSAKEHLKVRSTFKYILLLLLLTTQNRKIPLPPPPPPPPPPPLRGVFRYNYIMKIKNNI